MPGCCPASSPHTTTDPTTFVWASPHAPIEFLVIVIVAVLVLAMWFALRREDDGD